MGGTAPRTQPKKILNRRVTIANMMPSPPVQKIPASTKMAGVVGVQPPGCNMCEEELPINANEAYEEGAVGGVRENLHLIHNGKSYYVMFKQISVIIFHIHTRVFPFLNVKYYLLGVEF